MSKQRTPEDREIAIHEAIDALDASPLSDEDWSRWVVEGDKAVDLWLAKTDAHREIASARELLTEVLKQEHIIDTAWEDKHARKWVRSASAWIDRNAPPSLPAAEKTA